MRNIRPITVLALFVWLAQIVAWAELELMPSASGYTGIQIDLTLAEQVRATLIPDYLQSRSSQMVILRLTRERDAAWSLVSHIDGDNAYVIYREARWSEGENGRSLKIDRGERISIRKSELKLLLDYIYDEVSKSKVFDVKAVSTFNNDYYYSVKNNISMTWDARAPLYAGAEHPSIAFAELVRSVVLSERMEFTFDDLHKRWKEVNRASQR